MPATDIKKKLHLYIDMIEDESHLEMLNDAIEHYATTEANSPHVLTPEQFKRLEESINQADNKMLTSHNDVMKQSKQWLTK